MNPIIVALDFPTMDEAEAMLAKVRPHVGMIKIGLEMFTANGWDCLTLAKQYNVPMFLDLKLYDIPNTVKKTVEVVCTKLASLKGEHFLSIHCLGVSKMCKAAVEAAAGSNVNIAGITFLTSLEWQDLRDMGYRDTRVANQTSEIVKRGKKWGITHFVCAPPQLSLMRKHLGQDAVLITPGIRAEGDDAQDHKRSKPASFALKNGANWLVIGRPITQAADPVSEAKNFADVAQAYSNY